jgi:hypothetical protein
MRWRTNGEVYTLWKANSYRSDWCADSFLNSKTLRKVQTRSQAPHDRQAREIRDQLLDIMTSLKIPHTSCGTDWSASSLVPHAAGTSFAAAFARRTSPTQRG